MRKYIVGALIALMGAGAMSGTAFAGEVTGSGKGGPNKDGVPGAVVGIFAGEGAQSICAFSGLEDGSEPGSVAGPGNTQNWGQIPHQFRPAPGDAEHPGNACNGKRGFVAGGG